jgi:hypothetical protein
MPCRGAVQNVVPTATWRPEFGNPLLLVKCIRCEAINAVFMDFGILFIWRLPSFHTNLLPWSPRLCLITTHQTVSRPIIHERIHNFFLQQSISVIVCNLTLRYISQPSKNFFFLRTHDSFYKCLHGLGLMTQRDNILSQSAGPSFTSRNSNYTLLQNLQNVRALGISHSTNYTTEQFAKAFLL